MRARMLPLLSFWSMMIFAGGSAAAQPKNASSSEVPVYADAWSGVTAGAAAGYYLAKHPYWSNSTDPYTADGYEKAAVPGIVGAVRRNFVRNRSTTTADTGAHQTCEMACREFGKDYEPNYQGRPLHQDVGNGSLIKSGIGDMASLAYPDHDFYLGRATVAGMAGRSNTYHESDVAQADFWCCHIARPQVTRHQVTRPRIRTPQVTRPQ